ncbi:chemotaxis protein CheD [Enterococcus italicus]|jgi:chemotaxis protein CheD|uniref:chemotaxis protein CheD n=1 Tax=Enterococcus italicus TaxID=246144 RepID=UPI00207476FC|nr:chemotaxis protein CheD [Enterococcus italicus]MCM6881366.1 chemotaxis protein CheD [Enterococcus italicus]
MVNAEEIKVKISDYQISQAPNKLVTVGLGSCIGTIIYDERSKIGGLSHIMLPDSLPFSNKKTLKIEKFADLAIPQMVEEIRKKAPNARLKAKIVGGANMFGFHTKATSIAVGARNIEAVEVVLKELRIPIIAKEVGGSAGRTMIVDLTNFETAVRIVNHQVVII